MGVSVGRLREDKVYDWKFVGLSHNTVRGAAGGAVLCRDPDSKKDISQRNKEKRFKNRLKEMSAKKKTPASLLLLHFVCHFVQYSGNAARMSETFLIIDMMLGSQGLHPPVSKLMWI